MKVYVQAPADLCSGGPELLHQLVGELRSQGVNAYIFYRKPRSTVNPRYEQYNVCVEEPQDEVGNLIVLPEVGTHLAKKFKRATVAIWWLSIDNYFESVNSFNETGFRGKLLSLARKPLAIGSMAHLEHFSQSWYARDFLESRGFQPRMLSDFLSDSHLVTETSSVREDRIALNPKKGLATNQRLFDTFPHLEFAPIKGLSPKAVADLLRSVKLYIDFGAHPGKDRIPREAAMAGCCVVTGLRGAARNEFDVYIPSLFKLDEEDPSFLAKFASVTSMIFDNFEEVSQEFDLYRNVIRLEPDVFRSQVRDIFAKPFGVSASIPAGARGFSTTP